MGSKRSYSHIIWDWNGTLFDEILGLSDIYAKSKTDIGLEYIDQNNIDRAGTVLVGDTKHDYEVANTLGIDYVLIPNGHKNREMLLTCGVPVLDDISCVVKLYQRRQIVLNITYRAASIDDLKTVTELSIIMCEGEYCGEHDDDEMLRDMQNPEKVTFIAFDGDKAVGYSRVGIRYENIWTESDVGPWGHLETIFVLSDYHKNGIAQTLVAMCEDWAREHGCVELGSDCDLDNEGSLAFHLKIGFNETHRLIHFSKKLLIYC